MSENYDYVIVGGGMTAAAAAQGIREVDPVGSIAILSPYSEQPYDRPPLTKGLWKNKKEDSIWRKLPDEHMQTLLGRRVTLLMPEKKSIRDSEGRVYGYKKLLLATGGSPRQLDFAPPETVYFRTVEDYHTLRGWAGQGKRVGVVGGGFIGSEIAAALAMNNTQAVMIFPESGITTRIFPKDLSDYVTQYYRDQGVEVHAGVTIKGVDKKGGALLLHGSDGSDITVDHLVAGIGITPNIELAEAIGVRIADQKEGGGIWVDTHLQTDQPDIYAAGDVASFYHYALQQYMRVEHEDNANEMGRVAGLNMAGRETAYTHQPFFYSDLFDLGYEAVGECKSSLETFADWKEPFKKGVVYYRKDGVIRGVLLWNTWDQVDAARRLIAEGETFTPAQLKGLLPKT